MSFAEIRKTVAAALFGFGSALSVAAVEDGVTANEWYLVLASTLVTAAGVWYVPNKPPVG